jgi:hypothetical protein
MAWTYQKRGDRIRIVENGEYRLLLPRDAKVVFDALTGTHHTIKSIETSQETPQNPSKSSVNVDYANSSITVKRDVKEVVADLMNDILAEKKELPDE